MLVRYGEMLVHVRKEYAAALLASARVQVVDGYHRMMTAKLAAVHADVRLLDSWKEFVRSAAIQTCGKRLAELKYLIAAYAMYVADEPAHPVGTPFPGGYSVELHVYITVQCVLPRARWMRRFAGSALRCRAVSEISCLPAGSVSLWNAERN